MMKIKILLLALIGINTLTIAQNDLLSDAITGSIPVPMDNIEFVYDGTDLVLVAASNFNGYLYAIDFNHSNADGVHDWESNTIPNIIESIASIVGEPASNLLVWDMAVNPKTKSVLLLIINFETSGRYLFEAKNPSEINLISFEDVTYSRVKYTSEGNYIHDMKWSLEENKLYYTQGDFTLDASIGYVEIPFEHNSEGTINATSVFKSNWGGNYFTNAPLEKISISKVNGENRIMGVTTCAPGFSLSTAEVNEATEIISVTEDFNVRFQIPLQVVSVTQSSGWGTATYLFDLHGHPAAGTQILRVGEKYLSGSVLDTNAVSDLLRNESGNVPISYHGNEVKEMALGYQMIAFFSNYSLMVVDDEDVLRLMDVTSEYLGIIDNEDNQVIEITPNPSSDFISLNYESETNLNYKIFDSLGNLVLEGVNANNKIDIRSIVEGTYIISFTEDGKPIGTSRIIKE